MCITSYYNQGCHYIWKIVLPLADFAWLLPILFSFLPEFSYNFAWLCLTFHTILLDFARLKPKANSFIFFKKKSKKVFNNACNLNFLSKQLSYSNHIVQFYFLSNTSQRRLFIKYPSFPNVISQKFCLTSTWLFIKFWQSFLTLQVSTWQPCIYNMKHCITQAAYNFLKLHWSKIEHNDCFIYIWLMVC